MSSDRLFQSRDPAVENERLSTVTSREERTSTSLEVDDLRWKRMGREGEAGQ